MVIVTGGIDLAKSVLTVHGMHKTGKSALMRTEVPRA